MWTPSESLAQRVQKFSDFFHICNFCSATMYTLKLGDRVLSLIQAENVAINHCRIIHFWEIIKEILLSWVHFCTLVNVIRCCSGSSRTFPCTLIFPIEMTCYRGIRCSVVRFKKINNIIVIFYFITLGVGV